MSNLAHNSNKYKRMCGVYRLFGESGWDYSESAREEQWQAETLGGGVKGFWRTGKVNGYAAGKKFMDITISGWIAEAREHGWLRKIIDLKRSGEFPVWFLKKVFRGLVEEKRRFWVGDIGTQEEWDDRLLTWLGREWVNA